MKDRSPSARIMNVVRILVLIFFFLLVTLPIYWMIITSIKETSEVLDVNNITYFPQSFSLESYKNLFSTLRYGTFLKNSIYLSLQSALVVTVLSVFGGYGLARFEFKGKGSMMLFVLITQMIPTILVLIPMYSTFAKIGVISKMPHLALFFYYVVANIPFCVLTMKSFFERIPYTLEEAAWIDGCSRMKCIRKIVLPVMLPGIVAVFCFSFIGAWNELMAGIIFTSQRADWTIPVGLKSLISKLGVPWNSLMAGGVLALLPTAIMFFFVQKYIVAGLTAGAVKE